MRELDANPLVLRVRKVDDVLERRDLRVGPEAGILLGDATLRCDCYGLDDGEAGFAGEDPAEVGLVPKCEMPVLCRILTEGG